ncbi:MAG: hypothetical protein ACRD4U_06335 [Candidatus Acidiferrales bacterium]
MKPRFYLASFAASLPLLLVLEFYFRGIQGASNDQAFPIKVFTIAALILGSLTLQALILHWMPRRGFLQALGVASAMWFFFSLVLTIQAFTIRPLLAHDVERTLENFLAFLFFTFVIFALPPAVATSAVYSATRWGYLRWARP